MCTGLSTPTRSLVYAAMTANPAFSILSPRSKVDLSAYCYVSSLIPTDHNPFPGCLVLLLSDCLLNDLRRVSQKCALGDNWPD